MTHGVLGLAGHRAAHLILLASVFLWLWLKNPSTPTNHPHPPYREGSGGVYGAERANDPDFPMG